MADDKTQAQAKPASVMGLAMAWLLIGGCGLGGGYVAAGVFQLAPAKPEKPKVEQAAAPAHATEAPKKKKPPGAEPAADEAATADVPPVDEEPLVEAAELDTVPFPAVVTNIANPETVWIRVEGFLRVKHGTEAKPEQLAAGASQQMLAYLRSIKLADLQGTDGFYAVIEDLSDVVKTASAGDVQGVMISGLIVE